MSLYDLLSEVIEQDNQRIYETVGQPAPNTVTVVNGAETAFGFDPLGESEPLEQTTSE